MPLLTRKRVILAKIETTYGTDPTPTGTLNAVLVRNLSITPQASSLVSRDVIRPYLGNYESFQADTHVELEFEVEAAGSGAAGTAPGYGALLRGCGLSETVTASTKVEYKPVSTGFESVTIYYNVDGVLHKVTGARGNVSLELNARQIPVFKFKMMGIYNAPSDVALPSVSYSSFQVPLIVNSTNTPTFSLFSVNPVVEQFSFDVGNSVNYRALVGSSYIQLIDRRSMAQAQFEATSVATKDWWSLGTGTTTGAISITHGTASGNKIQFTAGQAELVQPSYTDNNGVQMLQSDMTLLPTSAGNDEFTLTVL
jgi:hypothetical protein